VHYFLGGNVDGNAAMAQTLEDSHQGRFLQRFKHETILEGVGAVKLLGVMIAEEKHEAFYTK
jgi:threonine dehydratase